MQQIGLEANVKLVLRPTSTQQQKATKGATETYCLLAR
jgi:hypothetical protein